MMLGCWRRGKQGPLKETGRYLNFTALLLGGKDEDNAAGALGGSQRVAFGACARARVAGSNRSPFHHKKMASLKEYGLKVQHKNANLMRLIDKQHVSFCKYRRSCALRDLG